MSSMSSQGCGRPQPDHAKAELKPETRKLKPLVHSRLAFHSLTIHNPEQKVHPGAHFQFHSYVTSHCLYRSPQLNVALRLRTAGASNELQLPRPRGRTLSRSPLAPSNHEP